MCMGCCGFIPFEWAVEHGYVNGKMTRAVYQKRWERWKEQGEYGSDTSKRPAPEITPTGVLVGPDGLLVNLWKSAYLVKAMEGRIPAKGESAGK